MPVTDRKHIDISDGDDGNLDITHNCDYIARTRSRSRSSRPGNAGGTPKWSTTVSRPVTSSNHASW